MLRSYREVQKESGKLNDHFKTMIIEVMEVWDNGYKYEVAGIAPKHRTNCVSARSILGGILRAMCKMTMYYPILVRAAIDGLAKVIA